MAGVRKERPFPDGLANGSYPTLCCPSRSVPVREPSRAREFATSSLHVRSDEGVGARLSVCGCLSVVEQVDTGKRVVHARSSETVGCARIDDDLNIGFAVLRLTQHWRK